VREGCTAVDIAERREHKVALGEARVRDRQRVGIEHLVTVQHNVQIDDPRPPPCHTKNTVVSSIQHAARLAACNRHCHPTNCHAERDSAAVTLRRSEAAS